MPQHIHSFKFQSQKRHLSISFTTPFYKQKIYSNHLKNHHQNTHIWQITCNSHNTRGEILTQRTQSNHEIIKCNYLSQTHTSTNMQHNNTHNEANESINGTPERMNSDTHSSTSGRGPAASQWQASAGLWCQWIDEDVT